MGYLVLSDYKKYIQTRYFNELVQGDDSKRIDAEATALSMVIGHLTQKYDVSTEFTETLPYDATKAYGARDRFIIDFAEYSTSKVYAVNDLVIYAGYGYICIAVTTAGAFDDSKWTKIGKSGAIYFASYPSTCTYKPTLAEPNEPEFNYLKTYKVGDIVYWRGYTYECAKDTLRISHSELINLYQYSNVPFFNVFPDDLVDNANGQYWKSKTIYTVPAGTLPTNTTFWQLGDNRESQLVSYMTWIVVDMLAPLISPENVPDVWSSNASRAAYELDKMAKGEISVRIPVLQPKKGARIRSGGNIKQDWSY